MKRRIGFVIVLLLLVPVGIFPAQAAEPSHPQQNTVDKPDMAGKNVWPLMGGKASKKDAAASYYYHAGPIKDAGLSYQESLTLPVKGSYACKNEIQLRVLAGMHGFDLNYALVFGRKKEFVNAMKFLNAEILGRLKKSDYVNPNMSAAEETKKLLADITDPRNLEKYKAYWSQQMDANMKNAARDPQLMESLLDQWYGSLIESSYVLCNLALNSTGGDKLYSLFIDYMLRVDALDIRMQEFYNSEYGRALEQADRKSVFAPIRELIQKKHGLLDRQDIKFILSAMKKVRAEYVKPCK
ncbi:MAG: hypothetical protein K4571_11060 [Deltaproteobacteria bacterium]